MKYEVCDKVLIKSIDWYNDNKDEYGNIDISHDFTFYADRSKYCGRVFTIDAVFDNCYTVKEDNHEYYWSDEMIEGLAEEEVFIKANDIYNEEYSKGEYCHEQSFKWGFQEGYNYSHENDKLEISLKEGYQFKDEHGNVINATKIVLEKKKEVIPNLQLDSVRTVREYDTAHSRIWLEIYEDNPELCIFTHLLVDEDHRQKGYGTKAIKQAEIIAKELGCNTIQLKVETYSWMSKWYLRSGYNFLTNAEDNYTWLTKSI